MMRGLLIKIVIATLTVALSALMAYYPHFSSPYPINGEEWYHLGLAQKLLVGGDYPINNIRYGLGYHLSLMPVIITAQMLGKPAYTLIQYLPVIYVIITTTALLLLVTRFGGGFLPALFSIVFLIAIPNNNIIKGLWFAVPLTLATTSTFLFILIYITYQIRQEKKYRAYAVGQLLFIGFIHPPTAAVLIVSVIAYQMKIKKIVTKDTFYLLLPAFIVYLLSFLNRLHEGGGRMCLLSLFFLFSSGMR
jgi:hypothetical protein